MNEIICPDCASNDCKKNGHIHNGKQSYRCKNKDCGRQFVLDNKQKIIPESTRILILKALLERNSLCGIWRIFSITLTWLLSYIAEIYTQLADDLNFRQVENTGNVLIVRSDSEYPDWLEILWLFPKN